MKIVNHEQNIINSSNQSGHRFKELWKLSQNKSSSMICDNDELLYDLLKVLKVRTLVVGVGGAGNNTVSRLQETGIKHVETLNVNTDIHDLYYSNSKKKLLIGKETCGGRGSGNNPNIGQEAALEDSEDLKKILDGNDLIFLTCGLGGGTGTGAAPIIAKKAKENNSLVVTFCTLPFKSEGLKRQFRANKGLKELAKYSDTLIPLPNENLLRLVSNAPMLTCFKIMDEVLVRTIREIVNLINNCGLVNLDFADLKKIFEKTGKYPSGLIGITETLGKSENDLIRKTKLAINNPLLRQDSSKVNKCIVSVSGDHTLSLSKVNKVITTVSKEISRDAELKFGTNINPTLKSKIRIMFLGKGPISPYVLAAEHIVKDTPAKTIAKFNI